MQQIIGALMALCLGLSAFPVAADGNQLHQGWLSSDGV